MRVTLWASLSEISPLPSASQFWITQARKAASGKSASGAALLTASGISS